MRNFQLPTSNFQTETTKDTNESKSAKKSRIQIRAFFFATLSAFLIFAVFVVTAAAQQLLDHVVARVGTTAVTQTDVDAALAFGIVNRQAGEPVKQMIDRKLMLAEVEKFRPPEPAEAAIAELVAKMKATAGAQIGAVMKSTGVDEKRLTELARETLRIQSYIQQRFGNSTRSEQQMERWLNDLRARGDVAEVSRQ